MNTDTIAARSTPRGKGAIAIIRVSGPRAISIMETCLEPQHVFSECRPQHVGLYTLVLPQTRKTIDQVTAVKYVAPHSYTGEDMVELFCHGGEIVVDKAFSVLLEEGVDIAERGEFTRRGFLNGKFDLLKAESILGLIESRTEKEYTASIEAYMGSSAGRLTRWKEKVKEVLRDVEAAIEFPEAVDVKNRNGYYVERIAEIRKEIEMEVLKRQQSHIIEKGIILPVVGIANAGKSSLFNLLLGFDRSIVHSEEGTTRDGVGEEIQIGAERVTVLDTAGLRETTNEVEHLGIQKTWEYIKRAAMVIWVTPANKQLAAQESILTSEKTRGKVICVISKVDLADGCGKKDFCEKENIPWVAACLLDSGEREELVGFVGTHVEKKVGSLETSNFVRTKRHEIIVRRMIENLVDAEKNSKTGEEFLASNLKRVLSEIGELVGDTTNEEILDSIFSEFCIGK